MIIGKNSFNSNNTFNNRFNEIKENDNKNHNLVNPIAETTTNMAHTNINSRNEMYEKSFAMLQDRLRNGLISVEEFNSKCNELNKKRNN